MGTKECKNRGVSKSTPLRGDVERRCCSAPVTRQIGDAGFCNWSSISNGDGRSDVGVEYGAERILVDERVGGNQMGRPYKKKRDREAVRRIFRESGWIEDTKEELAELDRILDRSSVRVADVDGDAECAVTTVPGDYRHGQETLPYSIVASVNTGRIGRKRGLATRVLAESLAESKRAGAAAAGLGFFEQGFYDRLGFGTTCYERHIRFDPANLSPDLPSPEPIRLGLDDYREIHDHLRSRLRQHGSVNVGPAEFTRFAMFEARNGFALGIREGVNSYPMSFYLPKMLSRVPTRSCGVPGATGNGFLRHSEYYATWQTRCSCWRCANRHIFRCRISFSGRCEARS